jgi:hypothetical protein
MVELLLDWNKNLTMQVDKDGSAPLHFASARNYWTGSILRIHLQRPYRYIFHWFPCTSSRTLEKVFKANPAALYQADKNGFFPIHVAASISARDAIGLFVRECPGSAGLRDAKGKTFLHVAIEKRILGPVYYACGNPSLASILNMQDNDGNTALHSAIQAGSLRMFCALFGNPEVNLNLTNNIGETPRDLSRSKLWRGIGYTLVIHSLHYFPFHSLNIINQSWQILLTYSCPFFFQNSENIICYALSSVGANHGALRRDKTEEKYSCRTNPEDEDRESQRLKDATQTFIVASVLIATMAFTATFAIPGGYRADDRTNGGTPTLAGGYIFDAFIMATALAFICSLLATTGFMLAGIPIINLTNRKIYLVTSDFFFSWSVTCISIVFALGVYMVLAPVARSTAVIICVITPAILVIGKDMGYLFKMATLARPLCVRKGLFLGMLHLLDGIIFKMAFALWPFVVIFGWGGLARIHHRR